MNKNNPQSELAMLRDPSYKKSKKDIKVSKITNWISILMVDNSTLSINQIKELYNLLIVSNELVSINKNPNLEIAQNCLLRSDLYLEQQQVLAAIVLLLKAIQLDPKYAIAHSNLGNILKDVGKFKDAESSYRKAIEINPL